MTNKEAAGKIKEWVYRQNMDNPEFAGIWEPTENCSKKHQERFAKYRENNLARMSRVAFIQFVLEYVDQLETNSRI